MRPLDPEAGRFAEFVAMGTVKGVIVIRSFSRTISPACSETRSMLRRSTSRLQGPLLRRNSFIRGIAYTGISFVPSTSRPRWIRPP